MAEARVAKRYAEALFNVAVQQDVVTSVEDDLKVIAGLLQNDPRFHSFIYSPYVAREEKLKIAEKLFSDRITALTMYLVRLVLHKRRERELDGIYPEFVALRRHRDQALFVTVSSAVELDGEQKDAVKAKAASLTGKTIDAEFQVDPSLLGGLRIAYENHVIDGSIQGNLERLRTHLLTDSQRPQ